MSNDNSGDAVASNEGDLRAQPSNAAARPVEFNYAAQAINAILIGTTPAFLLLAIFAAADYLSSRLFFASGYSDPITESSALVEDPRFSHDYTPYDTYAWEAYASSDIAANWSHLDPIIRTRIWLRSMYPIERHTDDIESNETTAVIANADIAKQYSTTTNPVELYSRAVSRGRPDDVVRFLRAYDACTKKSACDKSLLKDQINALLYASYVIPARDLILEGQCLRARIILKKAAEIRDAVDLDRTDDNTVSDLILQLLSLTEHSSCVRSYTMIETAIRDIDDAEPIDMSKWPSQFSELRDYGVGVARFRDGNYSGAIEMFQRAEASESSTLVELSRFMIIRTIFWSIVYAKRPELVRERWLREHPNADFYPVVQPVAKDIDDALHQIGKIRSTLRTQSMLNDVDAYEAELVLYRDPNQ